MAGYRQAIWSPPENPEAGAEAALAPMEAVGAAMVKAAENSVTLAIGLVGLMALFLGLMKVAEAGGLLTIIAKTVRPMMVRLFPEVPPDHPAMGAIVLNMSANVLGLGNAATPFGIRAMQELDKLNPHKGTATDAMVLFLAINTASVTILPTSVIALRAAVGSMDPAGILPTTLFATICSTAVAIYVAIVGRRYWPIDAAAGATPLPTTTDDDPAADGAVDAATLAAAERTAKAGESYPDWISWLVLAGVVGLIPLTILYGKTISPWFVPAIMVGLLTFGVVRKVPVYDAFVEGAREGFEIAIRIIPYLIAILVAVGMFRASGALEAVVVPLGRITDLVGLPAEALPMALMRPLSGSGAYGVLAAVLNDPAIGPDSYVGYLVSTIHGSSETTFYVLAVYFGAVGIRRIRHALVAGLIADAVGVIASVSICLYLFSDMRL